jgi:hypothetical protein
MKRILLAGLLLFSTGSVYGQDSLRRHPVVGLEILRMPIGLIARGKYNIAKATLAVEPIVLIPVGRQNRFIPVRLGYIRYREATGPANIRLAGKGFFMKTGIERRRNGVSSGWLLTLSRWRSTGSFVFPGTFFGDYTGQMPTVDNFSMGVEWYVGPHLQLTSRLTLNTLFRLNLATGSGRAERGFPERYIPGLGYTIAPFGSRNFRLGAGANLFLSYSL